MSAPWYKCFPRDFNEGMVGLTLEERGAYITIINLIYSRSGPIPEDEWWLTSQLGCTTRAWAKVRAALIMKGKLYTVEVDGKPHLMNARADAEINVRQKVSQENSAAGKKGGENSGIVRNENKDLSKRPLQNCEANTKPYQISEADTEDDADETRAREPAVVIHLAPDQPDDWPSGDLLNVTVAAVGSPWLDPTKSPGLVTSAGRLAAWRREHLSWEHDVVPVLKAVAARAAKPIGSWKFFDGPMAEALAALNNPLERPVRVFAQRPHADPEQSPTRRRYSGIDRAMEAAVQRPAG